MLAEVSTRFCTWRRASVMGFDKQKLVVDWMWCFWIKGWRQCNPFKAVALVYQIDLVGFFSWQGQVEWIWFHLCQIRAFWIWRCCHITYIYFQIKYWFLIFLEFAVNLGNQNLTLSSLFKKIRKRFRESVGAKIANFFMN